MSNDLISRKALMQSLRSNVLIEVTPNLEQAIEEQPTAYDVDKVVGKIESSSTDEDGIVCYVDGKPVITKEVEIKIVTAALNKIGGWIPCSERLPDKNEEYVCTQEIYNLSNGKLSGKSVELVEFCDGKWRRAKHLKVIAWQPLPEAYKADEHMEQKQKKEVNGRQIKRKA